MGEEQTFPVTLMRAGRGLPYFEVAAYRYTGMSLPVAGDLITVTPSGGGETEPAGSFLVYVTRVDPNADVPIRATEAKGVSLESPDEFIVAA